MGNVDGYVIIEAKMDTATLEKQLRRLTNELERLSKKQNDLFAKKSELSSTTSEYKKQADTVSKLKDEFEKARLEEEKLRDAWKDAVSSGVTGKQLGSITGQYQKAASIRSTAQTRYLNASTALYRMKNDYEGVEQKIQNINQELDQTASKQEQIKGQIQQTTQQLNKSKVFDKLKVSTNDAQKSISHMAKKLTRVALAIFSVRSAFAFIRQAMSSVLGGNEKLKKQYDGIKQSIYGAFAPVITKIINLMRTLMAYMNYIWQRLTGHILFAEKGTLNASKNLSSGAKSAKEINRQLAGFDEMNVLSSNNSGSSGVGGGDDGNYDLGLSKIKIPDWLKNFMDWVEKHPTLSKILFGLTAFTLFGGWKLAGGLLGTIGSILGSGAGAGATGLVGILGTLKLIAAAAVLIYIDYKLVKYAIGQVKELRKEQKELKQTIKDTNDADIEKNKTILDQATALDVTNEKRKKYMDQLYKNIEIDKEWAAADKNNIDMQFALKEMIFKTASAFEEKRRQGQLTEEEEYRYYQFLRENLTPEEMKQWQLLKDTEGAAKDLRNGYKELDTKFKTQYEIEVTEKGAKETKKALNELSTMFKNIFNTNNLSIQLQAVWDKLKAKTVFHASGGIVNLPGRGVPIDYAGERGREGLVPIDNQAQMSLLGSEIAKNITINLTSVTELDGRTIARKVQEVNNNTNFLLNR